MSGPKRVLLVAYYYPPRQGIGARRPAHLRKYLPRFGWEATILTAQLAGNDAAQPDVVATRYIDVLASVKRGLGLNGTPTHHRMGIAIPTATESRTSLRHRAISLAYQACTFPDREVGWTPFALHALRELLRKERFDAVVSTSPPHTAVLVAALAKSGVPWVADVRDLWTATDFIDREPAVRWCERRIERWMLQRASAITVTTQEAAEYLARRFPSIPVRTIFNGFDPQEWRDIPFGRNARCTLLFAGSLYHGRAQPALLFRAVRRLVDRRAFVPDDLSIDFYSDETALVAAIAETEGVREMVRTFDYVPREEILPLERRADRLLFFPWHGDGAGTALGGKVLEYLGARKPLLAIGGGASSAVDGVLAQTGAGVRCTSMEQIESEVFTAVSEFKSGRPRELDSNAVSKFDAPRLAQQFADLLDRVTETRRSVVW